MAQANHTGTHSLPTGVLTTAGYAVQILAGEAGSDGRAESLHIRFGESDEPVVTIDRSAAQVIGPILAALAAGRVLIERDALCPMCEGTGQVESSEDRWSHASESHYTVERAEECPACRGARRLDVLQISSVSVANVRRTLRADGKRSSVVDALLDSTAPRDRIALEELRPVSSALVSRLGELVGAPDLVEAGSSKEGDS